MKYNIVNWNLEGPGQLLYPAWVQVTAVHPGGTGLTGQYMMGIRVTEVPGYKL